MTDEGNTAPPSEGCSETVVERWRALMYPENRAVFDVLSKAFEGDLIDEAMFHDRALELVMRSQFLVGDSSDTIAGHQQEPWMVSYASAVHDWNTLQKAETEESLQELREQFFEKAERKLLTVEEAMLGSYFCLGPDGSRARRFFFRFLHTPRDMRVQRHNWLMLYHYPKNEWSGLGNAVWKLQVPLFPPFGLLKMLNERMLLDRRLLGGGPNPQNSGPPEAAVAEFFRIRPLAMQGSDYYVKHVVDADGRQVLDPVMSGIHARLDALSNELNALHAEYRQYVEVSSPGGGRGGAQGRAKSRHRQRQHPYRRPNGGYYRRCDYGEE